MSPLLIIVHLLLCVLCYAGQNFSNRFYNTAYPGEADTASSVFAVIYGIIVGLVTFTLNGFRFAPSPLTVWMGLCNGVALFGYILLGMISARRGPFAIISVLLPSSAILGILASSAFYWGDRLLPLQLVGISVMLAAFVLLRGGKGDVTVQRGFWLSLVLLFLSNGCYSIILDAQHRLLPDERNELLMITYACCAVLSLAVLFVRKRGKSLRCFRMGRRAFVLAVCSGVCASLAVSLMMFLMGYMPSYLLYPIRSGTNLVLAEVLCVLLLHEKFSKKMVVGAALAVVSIVILNL